MTTDDPLISLIAARNPVADPEALSAEQRAAAQELRERVQGAPPPRRSGIGRRMRWRQVLLAVVVVLPVGAVALLAVGIHRSPHPGTGHGGAGTLTAAFDHLDFKKLASGLNSEPAVLVPVQAAALGAPQTLLIVGSDHRAGAPYRSANTDTIVLIRLDPSSSTIKLLSIPRDLKVQLPQGTAKLNAAYSQGGPRLLVDTLRRQVFPGLSINHVLDVNLAAFADVINAIGCVYTDVDHRYYSEPTQSADSNIDIEPGYQQLCGQDTLQFVRYRHTDSALVRSARQHDFLRWARGQYPAGEVAADLARLLRIAGAQLQTDPSLHSVVALSGLASLVGSSLRHPIERVPFPGVLAPCTDSPAPCYLIARAGAEAEAYRQLMTPTSGQPATSPAISAPAVKGPVASAAGLIADPVEGRAQASALRGPGLPVYYPNLIAAGSHYCSTVTGNCTQGQGSADAYVNTYPREYVIKDGGHAYASYRITLVLHAALGQYYGLQGTTWRDPPILNDPTRTERVNGRELLEYFDGRNLSLVAWKTPAAAYWVSNTLTDSIPASQLIAIAASSQPAA